MFALLLAAIFSRGVPAESGSADTERSAAAKQRNEATGEGVRQPKPESETQRGKRLRDEALEGGYRVPCLYLCFPKTKAFYYNEEHVFHRESAQIAENYAAVRSGEFWGFADLSGEEIIPVVFDDAVAIDGDAAFVKVRENTVFWISRKPPPD